MRIRYGLCLLPVLFTGACTTTDNKMTTAEPPAPPESFAMLPDTVSAIPYGQNERAPRLKPAAFATETVQSGSMSVPAKSSNAEVDRLITTYAANYEVPESLVRRVVKRESNFRPEARNGKYWGLMQILPATARSMGFDGPPSALLDAETNLKYAVKYLKGAFVVAGGDHDQAVRNYARGYYYEAKRKGMLGAVDGLVKKRTRMPEGVMVASAGAAPLPGPATPAQNVASQWDTGFVTATSGKARPNAFPSDARMGGASVSVASAPATASVSAAPAATAVSFGPAGAIDTPSLGLRDTAD